MAEDNDQDYDPMKKAIDWHRAYSHKSKNHAPEFSILENVTLRFNKTPKFIVRRSSSKDAESKDAVSIDGAIEAMNDILTARTIKKTEKEYKDRLTMDYFEKVHGHKITKNETGEALRDRMKKIYQLFYEKIKLKFDAKSWKQLAAPVAAKKTKNLFILSLKYAANTWSTLSPIERERKKLLDEPWSTWPLEHLSYASELVEDAVDSLGRRKPTPDQIENATCEFFGGDVYEAKPAEQARMRTLIKRCYDQRLKIYWHCIVGRKLCDR